MMQVNLIPAPRLELRDRRRRVRLWVTLCTVWAMLMLGAYGAIQTMSGQGGRAVDHDVAEAEAEVHQTNRQVAAVNPRLNDAKLTLAASRAVGSQPHWSVLLSLLADGLGDDVVLSSVRLEPVAPAVTPAAAAPSPGAPDAPNSAAIRQYTLHVGGLGRTQAAVSRYVLQLERCGLFDRVTLIGSNRTPFADGEAIAFRLDCALNNR